MTLKCLCFWVKYFVVLSGECIGYTVFRCTLQPFNSSQMNSGLDYTGMQEFLMSVHTTVSPGFLTLTDLQRTTLLLLVDVLTNS